MLDHGTQSGTESSEMCRDVGRRMLIWARSFSKDRSLCPASELRLKRPSSELSLKTALTRQTGPGQEDADVYTKSSFDAYHPAKTWNSRLQGDADGCGGDACWGKSPPAAVEKQESVPQPAEAVQGTNCDGCVVWQ